MRRPALERGLGDALAALRRCNPDAAATTLLRRLLEAYQVLDRLETAWFLETMRREVPYHEADRRNLDLLWRRWLLEAKALLRAGSASFALLDRAREAAARLQAPPPVPPDGALAAAAARALAAHPELVPDTASRP